MSVKYFLYFIVTIMDVWSFDSININAIFKKNKIWQARLFYFFLAIALIYLVTNCIYDLYQSAIVV